MSSPRIGCEATLIYLDASAIVKLVLEERVARELRAWLATHQDRCTSVIGAIEVRRAVRRSTRRTGLDDVGSAVARRLEDVLAGVVVLALDDTVAQRAALNDPPQMRTLDSIHLATALSLDLLDGLVTYDSRLAQAADEAGVSVFAPAARAGRPVSRSRSHAPRER